MPEEPPLTNDLSDNHSRSSTFWSEIGIFCNGKPQRISHILIVWSYEPDAKIKEDTLNLTHFDHFECALNVLIGREGYRRSHKRIWPSSWEERIWLPAESIEVTNESLVKNY